VPGDLPTPAFIQPERWQLVGQMDDAAPAPLGFDPEAAKVGVRFNGFYLFVAFPRRLEDGRHRCDRASRTCHERTFQGTTRERFFAWERSNDTALENRKSAS
jgi:hypothetical protein